MREIPRFDFEQYQFRIGECFIHRGLYLKHKMQTKLKLIKKTKKYLHLRFIDQDNRIIKYNHENYEVNNKLYPIEHFKKFYFLKNCKKI